MRCFREIHESRNEVRKEVSRGSANSNPTFDIDKRATYSSDKSGRIDADAELDLVEIFDIDKRAVVPNKN